MRTIGQLAKAAGVSVETVRFYERRGIIARPPRPRVGWRQYGNDALIMIRYVKLAQELGLSLADVVTIKECAGGAPAAFCARVRSTVQVKLDALDTEIARLSETRRKLAEFFGACSLRAAQGGECSTYRAITYGIIEE